jgi:hypothetical protein
MIEISMRDEISEQSDWLIHSICVKSSLAARVAGATASARDLQIAEYGSQKEEALTPHYLSN